jgi:REP element-mobilizing transposase RayT
MPGKPRMYMAGVPSHVIQRGNNRDVCFFAEQKTGVRSQIFLILLKTVI